jgi:hypothetical protein
MYKYNIIFYLAVENTTFDFNQFHIFILLTSFKIHQREDQSKKILERMKFQISNHNI